jgi:hypothetical protein
MDAVTGGLIGGAVVSLVIYVAGAVAIFSGFWETMSSNYVLYLWIVVLTGLTIGQLVLTGFVVSALTEAPQQTNAITV